jgi:hypothetical protein
LYENKGAKMVEMRADILFDNPIQNYVNETQRKRNAVVVDLFSFHLGEWTSFEREYDFVEHSPLMMDARCTISGDEFLELVGATHEAAQAKLDEIFPTANRFTKLDAFDVRTFYSELKHNTIKEVTLCIVELW